MAISALNKNRAIILGLRADAFNTFHDLRLMGEIKPTTLGGVPIDAADDGFPAVLMPHAPARCRSGGRGTSAGDSWLAGSKRAVLFMGLAYSRYSVRSITALAGRTLPTRNRCRTPRRNAISASLPPMRHRLRCNISHHEMAQTRSSVSPFSASSRRIAACNACLLP